MPTLLTENVNDSPIFIVGTERSGSNLLRLILNAHSDILVPHPPHILHYFSAIESSYGDLDSAEHYANLVDDIFRLIDVHIYPWDEDLSQAAVIENSDKRSVFGAFASIYGTLLSLSGKKRWGCKSTFMIHHAEAIYDQFPNAKLIWLIRDPRDVAASSMKSVFNPFHPYYTGLLWKQQQLLGLATEARYGPERIKRLHYESLIEHPQQAIQELCDYLDVVFEETMLEFSQTKEAIKASRLSESWKNATSSVMRDNAGKYRNSLSREKIQAVELVAGALMQDFSYPFEPVDENLCLSRWHTSKFMLQDLLINIDVQWRSLRRDKNFYRRLQRSLFLKRLTISRCIKGLTTRLPGSSRGSQS
jgi:hypothetical protein